MSGVAGFIRRTSNDCNERETKTACFYLWISALILKTIHQLLIAKVFGQVGFRLTGVYCQGRVNIFEGETTSDSMKF